MDAQPQLLPVCRQCFSFFFFLTIRNDHCAIVSISFMLLLLVGMQSQQTYSPTPEAFLQKWMRSPSPDVCGHWQFEYGEAHKDIRSGFAPPRFITFVDPNTAPRNLVRPGLGDYLVGMATAFVVGLLTERAFVMEDSSLTQVVDVGEVNWRVGPDVPMGADKPGTQGATCFCCFFFPS